MMKELLEIVTDANTQWVLSACILLGISSGVIGSFTLLRKQSLIGDAMSHAALPGICIAFLLYGVKSIGLFMLGAAAAGLLAAYCINSILKYSRIKEDTALGLVLSVFFGIGIVLLTLIQRSPNGNKSGLDHFLFGKAASLVREDVTLMMISSLILLGITYLIFKELKLLCFDPNFGKGLGLPMGFVNLVLMAMVITVVVIGLQAVGVVLMSAMLITPAISARYWTERLDIMIILAGIFGAVSGAFGTIISALVGTLPTGPVIVLAATALFLTSLIFAPKRGLLIKAVRQLRIRNRVAMENILQSLYEVEEGSMGLKHQTFQGANKEQIVSRRPVSNALYTRSINQLKKEGLIVSTSANSSTERWILTAKGFDVAFQLVLTHRMWDMLLMYENRFAGFSVHHAQVGAEAFPEELETELLELLRIHQQYPGLDPVTRRNRTTGYLYQSSVSAQPISNQTVSQSKGSGL